MSGIMEKFIMVVRAIEDEWLNFAKSDDYKELADDEIEEAKLEQIELLTGKKRKRKYKISVDKPNAHVMDMIAAYRNTMMNSQMSMNNEDNKAN